MATKSELEWVPISKIDADPDQPRKNFVPEDMATLIASIKQHGIMEPLQVEKHGDRYLLEDGERRYRAAKELGHKEVPIYIRAPQTAIDRLILQFHLQEQRKDWSPVEKATAVAKLSQELKMSITEVGKTLALPTGVISRYVAFNNLVERKEFEKHETPLSFAVKLVTMRNTIRNLFEKAGEEFTPKDESAFELAVISRIKQGDIRKPADMNKIRDAARVSLPAIRKFIKSDKMTVQKLFLEADAKVAYHFRNLANSAHYLEMHINQGLPLGLKTLVENNSTVVAQLRRTEEAIIQLIGKK